MLKRALSSAGVILISTLSMAVTLPGAWAGEGDCIRWLSFEEGSGSTTRDRTGYHKDAVLKGNPQWVEGKVGRALSFDGDDHVDCGNSGIPVNGPATIAGWFKFSEVQNGRFLHNLLYAHRDNNFLYMLMGAQYWHDSKCATDTWYHIALTYDGITSTARLYIDGIEKSLGQPSPHDVLALENLIIGGHPKYPNFKGVIDEVKIYKRALTGEEVQQLHEGEALSGDIVAPDSTSEIPAKKMKAKKRASANLAVPLMASPVIDGRDTTADEWEGACSLTGWADNILGVANKDKTVVEVGYSNDALYIRMVYPVTEEFRRTSVNYAEAPLKTGVSERDGDIFKDDHLGFYLSPPESRDVYFFGVNGANVKRDSRNGDAAWNGQWQVNQSCDRHFWRVEFSLPLRGFGGDLSADRTWGINFLHGARQVQPMESVWAYRPAQTVPLTGMRFLPEKISVALLDFGDLNEGIVAFKGRIANRGTEPLEVTSEVEVADAGRDRKVIAGPAKETHALAPGEKKELALDFKVPRSLYGHVTVRIRDAKGTPLLDHTLPFAFSRDIGMEARYIPTPELLQVILNLDDAGTVGKVTGCTIKVISGDTRKEVLVKEIAELQALDRIEIDCTKLPVGSYEVVADVKMGPEVVSLKSSMTKDPPPEWLNNTVGISDKVPVPWTPLTIEGRKISCLLRDYTFGVAGFPSQISVLGKDILAGPVRVSAKVDGTSHLLKEGTFRPYDRKDTRISFKTVSHAGPVSVEGDTWIEYDGFVWNTMTFSSDKPATVESVSVEIPLKKEYATLWWSGDDVAFTSPMTRGDTFAPPQAVSAFPPPPKNFLRLGDEERGIQLYHESLEGWDVRQTLIPGETDYVIRYVARPTVRGKPRPLALGYMALPCKRRDPKFRLKDALGWSRTEQMDRAAMEKAGQLFQVHLYDENWSLHWNYLNFWNEDVFEKDFLEKFRGKWKKEWQDKRHTFAMYIQGGQHDANTPEYQKYRFEWQPVPGKAPYIPRDPKTRHVRHLVNGCRNARSSVDFQMWHLDKTLKYLSEDGKIPFHAYIDCYGHHNTACSNVLHGCPKEGRVPVLATREYLKRIYTIYKEVNPLNQIYLHAKENSMHAAGFCDVRIDGEQFTAPYMSLRVSTPSLPRNYTRMLNLAQVRASIQAYAWGPERYHLYQFWKWNKEEPDEVRAARAHLWGLTFSHDVPVWSAGTPANIPRAVLELGWNENVEFIPYWRKQTGIEVSSSVDPVVASGWRRGDGNLLVMVVNDSDEPDVCRLKIDLARYGFRNGRVNCRDYGAAGLGYPDTIFVPTGNRRNHLKESPYYVHPWKIEVKEFSVEKAGDVPVEVKEHSYRLLRFFQ